MWAYAGWYDPGGGSAADEDWRRSGRVCYDPDGALESQSATVEEVDAWTCGGRCCG